MRLALVCAAIIFALTITRPAHAFQPAPYGHWAELDTFASKIAHRPVTVRCPTLEEEKDNTEFIWAWAYVPWENGPADYTVAQHFICEEARAIALRLPSPSGDEWAQALAVLTLTHESYHLWRVKQNGNEAVTECRAIKRFPQAVELLGGSKQLARNLLAEALEIHRFGLADGYALKGCKLPTAELPG